LANTLVNNKGKYSIYGASGYLQNIDFYNEDDPYIAIIKDGSGVGKSFLCVEKSSIIGTLQVIKRWFCASIRLSSVLRVLAIFCCSGGDGIFIISFE
jgi:hypothetical protein